MKRWRVHVTWPGGTATHDVEAETAWAANTAALRAGWVPDEGEYSINITPIPEGS